MDRKEPWNRSATGSPRVPSRMREVISPESPRQTLFVKGRRMRIYILRCTLAIFGSLAIVLFLRGLFMLCQYATRSSDQPDRIPHGKDAVADFFTRFEGHQDCGLASTNLYKPPPGTLSDGDRAGAFCKNRATLLKAVSGGGRHGFDEPFYPNGCHYRWYSTVQICHILSRFDGLAFVGDELMLSIYKGFTILLRENIALGALKQWDMSEKQLAACRCENQFITAECLGFAVTNSYEMREKDAGSAHKSPYICDRTPHMYIPITGPATENDKARYRSLFDPDPNAWKPVPLLHSLGLSTSLSWPIGTNSLDEWASLADSTLRATPMLALGPAAAGHLKPPGQILSEGNNALWHYTIEMGKEAEARGIEWVGLYNMTLQASSWDGSAYGLRVAVTQAMIAINWLARLESS